MVQRPAGDSKMKPHNWHCCAGVKMTRMKPLLLFVRLDPRYYRSDQWLQLMVLLYTWADMPTMVMLLVLEV